MNTLFDIAPAYPEGFAYVPSFITREEELGLIESIQTLELHNFIFHGYTANRKVASFGYDYNFENKALTKGAPIPSFLNFLVEKVSKKLDIPIGNFAELLVIEYPPGAVVNWHRDAPPFDVIAGISLESACTFRLRPQEKSKQTRSNIISLQLQPRSFYVMQGPARSEWQHSTTPVKQTRHSITLRTLKQ